MDKEGPVMKRMICLLLTLLLVVGCVNAQAVQYDSLAEKLARQLEKGSGLKGALTFTAAGDGEWVRLLAPLSGRQLSLRGLQGEDGRMEYSLFEGGDDGEHLGLTQLYTGGSKLYLRSDLLIDSLYSLPVHGDLLSSFTGIGSETPTFYSALCAASSLRPEDWAAEWAPLLERYEAHIDDWMTPYGAEPVVTRVGVVSQVEIVYELPIDAVKAEMKALLHMALSDEALLKQLRSVMTDEQNAAYLDPAFAWYYDQLIDGMSMTENVKLTRRMSAQGEVMGTVLHFPLVGVDGWTALTIETNEPAVSITLTGQGQSVTFTGENDGVSYGGSVVCVQAEGDTLGFAYLAEKTTDAYIDEENRTHEITDWAIQLDPVGNAAAFDPAVLQLRLHYYSKPAATQATTLEVTLQGTLPGGEISFAGRFRSVSPWDFSTDLPTAGDRDMSAMTAEERGEVIADLLVNALVVFGLEDDSAAAESPAEIPAPEADPSPAPAEEAAEAPAEEAAGEPAV